MGRNAAGVNAIRLQKLDEIVSTAVLDKGDPRDVLVVSQLGLGKRTPVDEYRPQGRNTQGVMTLKITDRNGPVVGVCVVDDDDEVMCISSEGVLIRVPVNNIRRTGRNAQGVKVVTPDEGSIVRAIAKVVREAQNSPEGEVVAEDEGEECPEDFEEVEEDVEVDDEEASEEAEE